MCNDAKRSLASPRARGRSFLAPKALYRRARLALLLRKPVLRCGCLAASVHCYRTLRSPRRDPVVVSALNRSMEVNMPPPIASATSSIAPEALSTEHSPAPAAQATVARPSSNSRWALPAPLARLSPFRHKMSSVAVHPKPGGAPRALLRDIAPDANAGRGGPKRQHGAEQRFGPSAPRSETHSEFSGSTDASRQRLGHLRNQLSSLISTQPSAVMPCRIRRRGHGPLSAAIA